MEINKELFDALIRFAKSGRSTDYVCGASFPSTEQDIKQRKLFDEFINNIEGTVNYPSYNMFGKKEFKKDMKYKEEFEARPVGDGVSEEWLKMSQNQSEITFGDPDHWRKEQEKLKTTCCGGANKPENKRKYLPTLSELVDRLAINLLKSVFIPEHRKEYALEISDIKNDINLILKEKNINIDADLIESIIIVGQYNLHIWSNEKNWRKGIREGNNLELTHGLNSIRGMSKNIIQELVGGRKDYKLDNVKAFPEWVPTSYEERYSKEN